MNRLEEAYAAYDSDPRVNGPQDYDAFAEAVRNAVVLWILDRPGLLPVQPDDLVAYWMKETA